MPVLRGEPVVEVPEHASRLAPQHAETRSKPRPVAAAREQHDLVEDEHREHPRAPCCPPAAPRPVSARGRAMTRDLLGGPRSQHQTALAPVGPRPVRVVAREGVEVVVVSGGGDEPCVADVRWSTSSVVRAAKDESRVRRLAASPMVDAYEAACCCLSNWFVAAGGAVSS